MSDLKLSATQTHNGNGLLTQAEDHSCPMAKTVIKHYGKCIPKVNKPRRYGRWRRLQNGNKPPRHQHRQRWESSNKPRHQVKRF